MFIQLSLEQKQQVLEFPATETDVQVEAAAVNKFIQYSMSQNCTAGYFVFILVIHEKPKLSLNSQNHNLSTILI